MGQGPETAKVTEKNAKVAEASHADDGGRPGKRTRRTPAEVRSALTRAARSVFEKRGYSGATTREIAREACVNEVLLFRHFSSKANLFAETVFEPFVTLFDEFLDDEVSVGTAEERKRFVAQLINLIKDNRRLIMAVINAQAYESDIGEIPSLKTYFTEAMQRVSAGRLAKTSGVDAQTLGKLVHCAFAAVVGALMLEPWILADTFKDEDELVELLTHFVDWGMYGKPIG